MKTLLDEYTKALLDLPQPMVAKFAPPADADKLSMAEERLNCQFPESLKRFFLTANGQEECDDGDGRPYRPVGDWIIPQIRFATGEFGLSGWGYFCSVETVVRMTQYYRECYAEYEVDDEDSETISYFGPADQPFHHLHLSNSEDPAGITSDLQPAHGGTYGQIVTFNEEPVRIAVLTATMEEFIELIVNGLKAKRFRLERGVLRDA
jgi:cell wall assembly regulator SMI1